MARTRINLEHNNHQPVEDLTEEEFSSSSSEDEEEEELNSTQSNVDSDSDSEESDSSDSDVESVHSVASTISLSSEADSSASEEEEEVDSDSGSDSVQEMATVSSSEEDNTPTPTTTEERQDQVFRSQLNSLISQLNHLHAIIRQLQRGNQAAVAAVAGRPGRNASRRGARQSFRAQQRQLERLRGQARDQMRQLNRNRPVFADPLPQLQPLPNLRRGRLDGPMHLPTHRVADLPPLNDPTLTPRQRIRRRRYRQMIESFEAYTQRQQARAERLAQQPSKYTKKGSQKTTFHKYMRPYMNLNSETILNRAMAHVRARQGIQVD